MRLRDGGSTPSSVAWGLAHAHADRREPQPEADCRPKPVVYGRGGQAIARHPLRFGPRSISGCFKRRIRMVVAYGPGWRRRWRIATRDTVLGLVSGLTALERASRRGAVRPGPTLATWLSAGEAPPVRRINGLAWKNGGRGQPSADVSVVLDRSRLLRPLERLAKGERCLA
jgi:hypothetical protein